MANCPKQKVSIVFKYKLGPVIYNYSMSEKEFCKKAGRKRPTNGRILGLTVSRLDIFPKAEGRIFKYKNKYCVGVTKIYFEIGFDKFNVYIDKKYRKGTCERRVIKEHEDEHVTIYREGMHFFAPDIKKAIRQAVKSLRPQMVSSASDGQRFFEAQANQVVNKLSPLLDHINMKLEEKQGMIDTPESYARTSRKCKNW